MEMLEVNSNARHGACVYWKFGHTGEPVNMKTGVIEANLKDNRV